MDKAQIPFNWKETCLFQRNSNLYTFSRDPLFKKIQFTHIYMPWDDSIENELMFKIKADITELGKVFIPLMNFNQKGFDISVQEFETINNQLTHGGGETHLIMTNLKSIHIFRVQKIVKRNGVKDKNINKIFQKNKYNYWLVVDDVFVLDVDHMGDEEGLIDNLNCFIQEDQVQNIFRVPHSTNNDNEGTSNFRWIEFNRNLTYDYFIRNSELKANIFQDSWEHLGRSTQHYLITCELERQKCVFYRDQEKWAHLKQAFCAYKNALVAELNEIYILPLVVAIGSFESLFEAWNVVKAGLSNSKSTDLIEEVLDGKQTQIDDLEDILLFSKNSKSLYYSLKNQFAKKFHKEEYLLIENFLAKQDSLVNTFECRHLPENVKLIIDIEDWIKFMDKQIQAGKANDLKGANLKLSHLVSLMISTHHDDNIFFKLLEEKMSKGSVQKSFADEVKSLNIAKIKKAA